MNTTLGIFGGAAAGAVLGYVAILSGKLLSDAARTRWGELLASIAHPLAVLIATITRRKLEAELSIAIHLAAIVGTFALAGACLGWLLSRR